MRKKVWRENQETYRSTKSIATEEGLARLTGNGAKVETHRVISTDGAFLPITPTRT